MSEKEVAPKTAKVKIKILRAVLINQRMEHKSLTGTIVEPGQEVEVSEAEAKLFCETKFSGHYAFGGERTGEIAKGTGDVHMHDYRRAVRVA